MPGTARFRKNILHTICPRTKGCGPIRSRSAVLKAPGQLEIIDLEVPDVHEDDGILKVDATGVCGSDAAAFQGKLDWAMPCVLGHEVIGTIDRLGSRAAERWDLQEGQRVAVEEYLPCGTCAPCTDGFHQTCTLNSRYGATHIDRWPSLWGGYGDYMYLHPQALVHPLPDDVPAETGQLFIPIANGLYWVQEVGECKAGDDVLIIGPGPHGLGCVVGARECGARSITVIGLERDAHRLSVATKLGASETMVLGDSTDEVVESLTKSTAGAMPKTVVNTATSPSALDLAVRLAGERATVVQVGVTDSVSVAFPVRDVWQKALTIKGVRGRPSRVIRGAVSVIASGRYPLDSLCSHRFSVDESEEALKVVSNGEDGVVRALICPNS